LDVCQLHFLYAYSFILYGKIDLLHITESDPHENVTFHCKFDAVVDEVDQYLHEAFLVGGHAKGNFGIHLKGQP
jgi:hypothetical protein